MPRSERTLLLMKNYIQWHNEGRSVAEISQITGVSGSRIYELIGEIAKENGVTRESLLDAPHSPHQICKNGGKNMSKIQYLKPKMLRELIKRGYTIADFCEKYTCTEEALRARVLRILCNEKSAKEAMGQIEANAKKHRPTTDIVAGTAPDDATPADETSATAQSGDESTTNEDSAPEEDVIKEESPDAPVLPETSTTSPSDQVEVLRHRITLLEEEGHRLSIEYARVDKLFANHYDQHNRLKREAEKIGEEIKEKEAELAKKKSTIKKVKKMCDELMANRDNILRERMSIKVQIDLIKREIAELTAIQIFVCEDGKIEPIDAPSFLPDDTGADALYEILVKKPECENLRIRDIHLLSKVLCICRNSELLVKATFDLDELQLVYDWMINEKS